MSPTLRSKMLLAPLLTALIIILMSLSNMPATGAQPDNQGALDEARADGWRVIIRREAGDRDLSVPPPAIVGETRAAGATIIVNYVGGGWTGQAIDAFQYAVDIWESLIDSPQPIIVDARFEALPPGILGGAGPTFLWRNFSGAPMQNTWYPLALANKLAGKDIAPAYSDITASFNNQVSDWYFGTGSSTPLGKVSFSTVVLHELGHGLGFVGTLDIDEDTGQASYGPQGYPAVYDRFTENGGGTKLDSIPLASLPAELTSNNLFFDGPEARLANSGARVPIYAPSIWNPGSSYSHLGESYNGTENALMTYSLNSGVTIHDPGLVTLCMFKDMGWSIKRSCNPSTPLRNGGFEDGPLIWQQVNGSGLIVNNATAAFNGSWYSRLGGGNNLNQAIEQSVTIAAETPYLNYWSTIESGEDNCSGVDRFNVLVNGAQVDTEALCSSANRGYAKSAVDLSAFAGQTVVLTFAAITNSSQASAVALDEVSFGTHPILPPQTFLPLIKTPYYALANSGFEAGRTGWKEFSQKGWPLIVNENEPSSNGNPARSGAWFAWLGGDNNEIAYIEQQISVPASAPYLRYYRWISSAESFCGSDFVQVKVDGTTVADAYNLCSSTNTNGYKRHSVDLTDYVNKSVLIRFQVTTNGFNSSSMLMDDVAFSAVKSAEDGSTAPEIPGAGRLPTR